MKNPSATDANKLLTLALRARVPAIHIKTDELLHVKEILEFLNGGPVLMQSNLNEMVETTKAGAVYVTASDDMSPKMYLALKKAKATCVWVNSKVHPLHLSAGVMVAPREMVFSELLLATTEAEALMPAVGGLTLKDVFEMTRVTMKRDLTLTAPGLNKTRQSYPNKLKGLSQIDTEYDYYDAPDTLSQIVDGSMKFFHAESPLCTLAPRGMLLGGPPGTGKTMAAKYLANKLGVPLYRLDVSGLKGKYVGDSEGALAAALAQLDQCSPCVVLVDEVEKLFRKGSGDNDAGVTLGLLGSMLWWLQEHTSKVLTVMTTNDAKALPPELHREGRISYTLTFNGLETAEHVTNFCISVLNVFDAKFDLSNEERKAILAAIEDKAMHMLAEGPLPHAKATQIVTDAVTSALVTRHSN